MITNSVDIEQPHACTANLFNAAGEHQRQCAAAVVDIDDNRSSADLGIMFLEMFFREPLKAHESTVSCGADPSFIDTEMARR